MDQLFVTGMFRSGTTLLARLLHTHEQIVCASDPYRPFFNSFRDSVAEEIGVELQPYAPLESYFYDDDQRRLFEAIQSASLNRSFDRDRDELLDRIVAHGRPFSPRIIENLSTIEGDSFREVYQNLLEKVPEYYGTEDEAVRTTKEVWTTEFIPAIAEAFPDAKFLLVVRDPRAVAASNNVNENRKYPWTFLARQWRKLATLTWLYGTDPTLSDSIHLVRYEDLVQSPRETVTEMCEFIGVGVDERVFDPSNFVDGHGDQWLQNTSYEGSSASFNTDSVDKWQQILDDRTVSYLEQCCYAEMDQFGYEFQTSTGIGIDDGLLVDPPVVMPNEMADWIKEYYPDRSAAAVRSELGSEHVRHRLLLCDEELRQHLDRETIVSYFLDERYFETVRSAVQQ